MDELYNLTEEQIQELEKLDQFEKDKDLAIFDELKDINKTLKVIANKEIPEPKEPIINVEIPEIKLPTINVPEITIPPIPETVVEVTTDKIEKGLEEIKIAVEDKPTVERPLPVVLTFEGKAYKAEGGKETKVVGGFGGGAQLIAIEENTNKLVGEYTILLDDVTTTNVTYLGKAAIGSSTSSGVWQIRKIDESSTPVTLQGKWAGGSASFSNVWDNRASLTYN